MPHRATRMLSGRRCLTRWWRGGLCGAMGGGKKCIMPQSPWNLMHEKGQGVMMEPTFLTVGKRCINVSNIGWTEAGGDPDKRWIDLIFSNHQKLRLENQGYPRKAGHPTLSTTARHDLIALPRSRQVFDLRYHRFNGSSPPIQSVSSQLSGCIH